MVSQAQRHRRRAVVRATHALGHRQAQGRVGSMKVVIEELQAHQRTPGLIAFGKRMRLARERTQPIA